MPSATTTDDQELLFDRIPRKQVFEEKLWDAADRMRAGARLKSSEFAAPVLGLFFLKYATNRFDSLTTQATTEFEAGQGRRNAESLEDIYLRLCGYYLPEKARFQSLVDMSGQDNAQQIVIGAMNAFEEANSNAFGKDKIGLPKNDYLKIPDDALRGIIKVVNTIDITEGDVFGKIYEYFLGKFALSEGQKGGEFYTPTSVVKLIVEVLEPHDGRIFDPACGTGGMFVQSAKFIQKHAHTPHISIYGQEKVQETSNLAKLNLFVNGLKGDIRNIDTSLASGAYTGDYADTPGKFDFVMANPPFNVDGVQLEDVKDSTLFTHYGLPVSAAKTGKKAEALSNANYLWVSLFATALKADGRAGFVMANSASDARGGELAVRQNLVDAGLVDVMVTISSNFFYTVTLPVTLWFFDRAKTQADHPRHDQTLFIDARKIFYQTSRSTRAFTQAQLMNITSIVWLYRGETDKFLALRQQYERATVQWRDATVEAIKTGEDESPKQYQGVATHRTQTAAAFQQLANGLRIWFNTVELLLTDEARAALGKNPRWGETLDAMAQVTSADLPDKATINAWYKRADEAMTFADKTLRPDKDKTFTKADVRGLLRTLATKRDDLLFVLERVSYFTAQLHWLDSHFPDGQYADAEGLCKVASRADIAAQNYSLNPGRYVGVALEDDGRTEDEFREFVQTQTDTLATLHSEADALQQQIAADMMLLFQDINVEEVI